MISLTKGQTVDLNKEAGKTLTKALINAGWDPAAGKTIDLDLVLIAKGAQPCFFNNKTIAGAELSGDDRTGASSNGGADEVIKVDVAALAQEEYTVVINIFDAAAKGQFFKDVTSAFVEMVDAETGTAICKYNMSEAGGDNSALVVGKLKKCNGALEFTAIGEYSSKDLGALITENGGTL